MSERAQLSLPLLGDAMVTTERASRVDAGSTVGRLSRQAVTPSCRADHAAKRVRAETFAAHSVGVDPAEHADGDRLLITVPEVARLLHIGRRQAWEMIWRGDLPVVRLGRSVRVARPVLERFVMERSLPYGA